MASAYDECALYHYTNIPNSFWYRQRLYPRSFIQLSEILLLEPTSMVTLNRKGLVCNLGS